MQVPFLDIKRLHHHIRQELNDVFQHVMDSGNFIMGSELDAFENEFASYCEVKHCIGVGNGLEALHLLLLAYGIGPGDEVIVPSNTFIATWLAVTQCGATPVPVEPDLRTHNIDPSLIASAITNHTKAIIPVHLYGQPADMDAINLIAIQYGLVVIEDAAQAQGSRYKGRRAGSLGHAAATSFYPGKNLGGMGDGGAVLTNDDAIADKVRRLRNYGSTKKYKHDLAGYNSRLDELQAAFLRVKLRYLDDWNTRRREIAKTYSSLLEGSGNVLPLVLENVEPVWHLYVIRSDKRDLMKIHLEKKGVSTVIHYPTPPHNQACYANNKFGRLPISEKLAHEVLSLPMSPDLSTQEIQHVVDSISSFGKPG